MNLLSDSKERSRFFRFALVGISGTFVDFGFFNLFSLVFHIFNVTASAMSFTIAVFNNFFWNRRWTYPESQKYPALIKFGQFLAVSIIGLGINTLIFISLDRPFIQLAGNFLPNFVTGSYPFINSVGDNLSKIVATLVVLFWNFFANRFWTYKNIE
jgi:putative flippase GtrA